MPAVSPTGLSTFGAAIKQSYCHSYRAELAAYFESHSAEYGAVYNSRGSTHRAAVSSTVMPTFSAAIEGSYGTAQFSSHGSAVHSAY